ELIRNRLQRLLLARQQCGFRLERTRPIGLKVDATHRECPWLDRTNDVQSDGSSLDSATLVGRFQRVVDSLIHWAEVALLRGHCQSAAAAGIDASQRVDGHIGSI